MRRPPATPPELTGYRPVSHLGSGGFADVFLYEQDLPRRRVAVKVLAESTVNPTVRQRFVAEANAMALLSAHPSIVTIYFAGISPDGRPCIIMEYCPRPNLAVRYRRETIPVDEALRIGVRVASAVETAHRADILHRDIKPANVLVTEYGWPALSDFGIAAAVDATGETEAMSVPWSAPELFGPYPRADVRTDIYALGATVYALLAGRSPFEVRGGSNRAADLIARIERDPLPPTGRRDAPYLLEQVLTRAMHKRPEARYRSAYEFAHALNEVEQALGLPPTEINVMDTVAGSAAQASAGEDDATRMRPVVTIGDDTQPAGYTPSGYTPSGSGAFRQDEQTHQRSLAPRLILGIGLAAVVAAVIVAVLWLTPGSTPQGPSSASATQVVDAQAPPDPTDLRCRYDGTDRITCTWKAPKATKVDGYQWNWIGQPGPTTVDGPQLTAPAPASGQPCVNVVTVSRGRTSPGVQACAAR